MRTFGYDKLVKDGVLDGMFKDGSIPDWRRLDDDREFREKLELKFLEEMREARVSKYDADEVADVMIVPDWLFGLSLTAKVDFWQGFAEEVEVECMLNWSQLEAVKRGRLRAFGGYSYRAYVKTVSVRDDNLWIPHYLAFPDLYPEITT